MTDYPTLKNVVKLIHLFLRHEVESVMTIDN